MKKKVDKNEVRPYPKEDAIEISRFYKIVNASPSDMNSIYEMYKKYISPNARPYATNCRCRTSISNYYKELMDWFSKNGHLFNE